MAINITGNEYKGTIEQGAIALLASKAEALQRGLVYVKTGVRSDHTVRRISVQDTVQDYAPTPASGGTVNVDYRKLVTGKYMVYLPFNPADFEGEWSEALLKGTNEFRELPDDLKLAMLNEVLKDQEQVLGQAMWLGDATSGTGIYKYYDGLVTILAADPDTLTVTSPVGLTPGNIISKLEAVLAEVPEPVRADPNFCLMVNSANHRMYGAACRALDYKSIGPEQAAPRFFEDTRIEPMALFPRDVIVATIASDNTSSNLWLGMDDDGDNTNLNIDRLQNNSDEWFIRMNIRIGTQVAKPEEAVLYDGRA